MSRKLNGSQWPMVNPSTLTFIGGDPACDHDYAAEAVKFVPGVLERHQETRSSFISGNSPNAVTYRFYCQSCGGYLAGEVYTAMESAMGIRPPGGA